VKDYFERLVFQRPYIARIEINFEINFPSVYTTFHADSNSGIVVLVWPSNALNKFGRTPSQIAMQYKNKEIAECLRNSGIYKTVRGCWLCEPGADLPVGCSPPSPLLVFSTPLENFGIPYLSCEYYLLY
jgi:hypothetical protein